MSDLEGKFNLVCQENEKQKEVIKNLEDGMSKMSEKFESTIKELETYKKN